MNPMRCLLMAACLTLATACEKHADPIGTVPAEDVPAVPVSPAPQDAAGVANCERMIGAEREACLRRYPPTSTTPVEPEKTSPPAR
ncbi:hypothetical protein [Luteimonas sp. SDU101]|uniref:hypothetical protein n=1 Tax=Luteimonas sp. SDU101 TaxID=3422593 RepID=UPI003EBE16F6